MPRALNVSSARSKWETDCAGEREEGRAIAETESEESTMSIYQRGETWWYRFWFNGEHIRESAKTDSKTLARDAEKARRRELETSFNRIPKRERVPLFLTPQKYGSLARQAWSRGALSGMSNA
jgi:hypothetical protein